MTISYANFSQVAAFRFGYGQSTRFTSETDPKAMVDSLRNPDEMANLWPRIAAGEAEDTMKRFGVAFKNRRDDPESYAAVQASLRDRRHRGAAAQLARIMDSPDPFRERLHWFWTDHFTTIPRQAVLGPMQLEYHDLAIRPHMNGRFDVLLEAAILHPMMLLYLDQTKSVGPGSRAGKNGRGLNENLAREVMELHTLGVASSYKQADVRQMALLLSGLTARQGVFGFNKNAAEPGAETVLGQEYGGRDASVDDIRAVLHDLAHHPDTARHIARKLAVHFVSDDPSPDLIATLAQTFTDADTELLPVYEALLSHPVARTSGGEKARQPFEWLATSLRGLGVTGEEVTGMKFGLFRQTIFDPMARMGQPWHRPVGPNGWPEEFSSWLSPPGLAERINWSLTAPSRIVRNIPDPRMLSRAIVPGAEGERLAGLAFRAERRSDGLALVLASPALNTR